MAKFLADFMNEERASQGRVIPRSHFLQPKDASITVQIENGPEVVVKHFQIKPDSFLNKSIIIYGPTGSGKTTVMRDIMYHAKELFPIVFAFAPTNMEKHDFDKIIPAPLVHEKLSGDILRRIYSRQQAAARTFNEVNKLENLRNLFNKVATREAINYLKQLDALRQSMVHQVEMKDISDILKRKDIEKIDQIYRNKCAALYKSVIHKNRSKLLASNLTNEERKVLRYLWLNPRALVVFDDATSELMEILRTKQRSTGAHVEGDIMKNFFFKNRHAHMTHWYTFHDDCRLDSDIRKNAFYNIFTDKQVAHAYFDRPANNFSKLEKRIASAVIDAVFDPNLISPYAKLLYERETKQFYYIVAEPRDNFTMCSNAVWQFCKGVETDEVQPDMNNPFMQTFNDRI